MVGLQGIQDQFRHFVVYDGVGSVETKIIDATVGRILFNEHIPQDLGFVDRNDPEKKFDLEIGFKVRKKELGKIIDKCLKVHGTPMTAQVLDKIKAMGYKYSTKAAITVAVCDATIPPEKKDILANADAQVQEINEYFNNGFIFR